MKKYQDAIVDGIVVDKGGRECAQRFEMIRPVLDLYRRPFTVLDIGANIGYFGFRIAHEYPQSVVVMIEGGKYWKRCAELCRKQSVNNVILLKRRLDPESLSLLQRCEMFDVCLCLSFLHHYSNWLDFSRVVAKIADDVIVETPPTEDVGAVGHGRWLADLDQWWADRSHRVLGLAQRGTSDVQSVIRWYHGKRPMMTQKYMNQKIARGDLPRADELISWHRDYERSEFEHKRGNKGRGVERREWYPGINGATFLEMDGVWPKRRWLEHHIKMRIEMDGASHGDLTPRNVIVSGHRLRVIDEGYGTHTLARVRQSTADQFRK